MNYTDYKNVRDAVWRILIEDKINALPVKIAPICKRRGITVKLCDADDHEGTTNIVDGKPVIFISSKIKNKGRMRFTIAHELGHILLGHVSEENYRGEKNKAYDVSMEREADLFASRLLAPACVLWSCNATTTKEIKKLCNVSYRAASSRARRLQVLTRRKRFLCSPRERIVYEQFLPFIRKYRTKGSI